MGNITSLKHLKLDLTSQCNQSCIFCPYHGCNSTKSIDSDSKLDKNIIKNNIFDGLDDFKSLQISGSGEGMLHPDFEEIVNFIRTKVSNLRIITNGTLIKKHNNCIIRNFDSVLVSLHGNEKTHEEIVRVTGSYKSTIGGILKLKELNYNNVKIHFVLTEKNIGEIASVIAFSKKYDVPIIIALDFIPDRTRYTGKIQELIETINYIRNNNFVINPNLNNDELRKFFIDKDYIINPHHCNHRNETIEIVSNGDIYVCRSKVFGNINEQKLSDIIGNSQRLNFLNEVTKELNGKKGLSDPRCNRCCYQKSPKHKQP